MTMSPGEHKGMVTFKIKYMSAAGYRHVYCRMLTADNPRYSYFPVGSLTVTKEQFRVLRELLEPAGVIFEEQTPDQMADEAIEGAKVMREAFGKAFDTGE